MANLQKDLVRHAQQLIREGLEKLISKKLEQTGVPTTPALVKALTDHILDRQEGEFTWKQDDSEEEQIKKIALVFTKDDLADIDRFTTRLLKAIPSVAEQLSVKLAHDIFKDLKRRWPEQSAIKAASQYAFQEHLEERWGGAFDSLRMLHIVSFELGAEAHKRHRRSKGQGPALMRGVLIQLHARACQVTGEILSLMENGYADGAMARWRTLHEIVVVALVIAHFGESIAERYVDHEIVEARKALWLYIGPKPIPGHSPFSKRQAKEIQRGYDAARAKHGKEFLEDNGWAADHLNEDRVTIRMLEDVAGRAAQRADYKLASYNVHAGVKGITFRLGLLDNPGVLAGASNAGFDGPGLSTAAALVQMNFLILGPRKSIEQLATMRVLLRMMNETKKAFARAANILLRDEKAEQKRKASENAKRRSRKSR